MRNPGRVIAAQNNAVRTNYIKMKIIIILNRIVSVD